MAAVLDEIIGDGELPNAEPGVAREEGAARPGSDAAPPAASFRGSSAAGPTGRRGSGGILPPVPPFAPQVPAARAPSVALSEGQRDNADVVVSLERGHIAYYRKGARFQATCTQPGHVRCRLTRTSNASDRRKAHGRPVGLLAAWLGCACPPDDHNNSFLARGFGHDDRKAARHAVRELPQGSALEACERLQSPAEADSEPEDCP